MINSINPFELIKNPTPADSRFVNPVHLAAAKHPKNFPQNAQAMTQTTHPYVSCEESGMVRSEEWETERTQMIPLLSSVRFVRSPE